MMDSGNGQASSRTFKPLTVVLASALMASGLAVTVGARYSPAVSKAATAKIAAPKLAYHGTITMFAQNYTPEAPGIKEQKGEEPLHELEDLAIQFHRLYPNITVKFVEPAGGISAATTQWYLTEATAGLLPDVYWTQTGWLDAKTLPPGIATNLEPYFNKPNPFIAGNKAWKDIMSPTVLQWVKSPTGAQYTLDGDWVDTTFYYNRDLFKKAGITTVPTTYNELLADCKILKAHGITPGAEVPNYAWYNDIFQPNFLGKALDEKATAISEKNNPKLGTLLYHEGIGNPAKNPRFLAWWPVAKKLYNYFNPAQNDININAESDSTVTGTDLFAAGKVAMIYEGSWVLNSIRELGGKFPIGTFNFPNLKGSSPYATSLNTALYTGGPAGAFQYAIASPKADNTMTPVKFKATLAWLQFIGTPAHDQAIVNESKSFLPTFKGTHPVKSLSGLNASDLSRPLSWVTYMYDDAAILPAQDALFQEYVSGHISYAAMKTQYLKNVSDAVSSYNAANGIHY